MAGYMTTKSVVVRQGDSFDIVMQFRYSNGQNMDLSDCEIKMAAEDDNKQQVLLKKGEIIDAGLGKARIKLTPKDTDLAAGNYKTDIQIKLKNGDVHTIFPQEVTTCGVLCITPEVTK